MRVVTVAYWAICADLPALRAGGDAVAATLTPVEQLERGGVRVAFDHDRLVRDAVERTRSKLEYTALAAKFCHRRSRSASFAVSTRRSGTRASIRGTFSATFRKAAPSRNVSRRRQGLSPAAGGRQRSGPSANRLVSTTSSRCPWSGRPRNEDERQDARPTPPPPPRQPGTTPARCQRRTIRTMRRRGTRRVERRSSSSVETGAVWRRGKQPAGSMLSCRKEPFCNPSARTCWQGLRRCATILQ